MDHAVVRRPRGLIRITRNGSLVWQGHNLVVNAGLSTFAHLTGGATNGQSVAAVGYGSGSATPTASDTDLSAAPKYYNPVGAATYPSAGTVTLAFALAASDYAAYGIVIQEIGLYANTGTVLLPAAAGFTYSAWLANSTQPIGNLVADSGPRPYRSTLPPAWAAGEAVVAGQLVTDSNGNLQQCTGAGTSGSSAPTTWATTIGTATSDATATWTCKGLNGYAPTTASAAPSWNSGAVGDFTWDNTVAWELLAGASIPAPMIAHAVVPSFVFGGSANYAGTWSLTF